MALAGKNAKLVPVRGAFALKPKYNTAAKRTEGPQRKDKVPMMTDLTRRDAVGLGGIATLSMAAGGTMPAGAAEADRGSPDPARDGERPLIVFDVNETLLDIDALEPFFKAIFSAEGRMREWFAQLILYSEALSLTGTYVPFGTLGGGILKMLGEIHGVAITDKHLQDLKRRIGELPVHPDAPEALGRLHTAGYRLVTLTNSSSGSGADPLASAGLGDLFIRRFTVDPVRRFKPAQETYQMVSREMQVPASGLCLVAAHVWDTIGAQAAGWFGVLVTHGVNAPLRLDGIPQPTIVGETLSQAASAIIARWG